jgi:hypothetical protein
MPRFEPNPRATVLIIGLVMALSLTACTGGGSAARSQPTQARRIPQPPVPGIRVAPDSERVDLAVPTFANPTNITNPLFPVSKQDSVLFVGRVEGKPFRTEVTLLDDTQIVEWEGLQIRTRISQYMAYLDGRVTEVAYDKYAQADDGSVWYFGEDVFDFENGAIVTTEGTWLAGRDGPAAMIMPGHPRVGDVYRTENVPGLAFEEVTVKAVDQTLRGPVGPIQGGMKGEELHLDKSREGKLFAPGYGEFYTAAGGEVEALALAVPTNAATGSVPSELQTLQEGASATFRAARSGKWRSAAARLKEMTAAWEQYRAGTVPRLIEPLMTRALRSLTRNVDTRRTAEAAQGAIDVGQWSVDLELRYRSQVETDLARTGLWADQLELDASRKDAAGAGADVFAIDYIRDRIFHTLSQADRVRLDTELGSISSAVVDRNFAELAKVAKRVRSTLHEHI